MIQELHSEDFFKHKGLPLAVLPRNPQPTFPSHKHDFSELVIITRGSGHHVLDDISFPVAPGDVFVMSKKHEHRFSEVEDLCLINILYDPVKLGMDKYETKGLPGFKAMFLLEPEYRINHRFESRLRISGDEFKKALDLAEALENEIEEAKPGFRLIANSIFTHLLYHLSRCYGKGISETPESHYLLQVAKAINYLEENFSKKIDFDELAKIACMSKRNFQRVFLQTMKCSAREHLLNIRLKHASHLLRGKAISISRTAYESGIPDSNYFAKQFKKKYGITPVKYRDHFS